MSFYKTRTWDNGRDAKGLRKPMVNGKTWTRRITWLEGESQIKLKFEDGATYKEVLADERSAEVIWARFREGQPIDDCVSILGSPVPESLKSRRAT